MNYIVFDLEFNQPSSKEQLILEPFPFFFEVVQIGAVKMDEKCNIKETIDIQVKPFYYKHLGNATSKRIGLYSKRFQQLMTFPEAYKRFLDFCGKEYCMFTWGTTDIDILNKNAIIHGLQPNDSVTCFDMQKMFTECFGVDKNQIALRDAIRKMHLEKYVAHNAFNDAYSTAEILSRIMPEPKKAYAINRITAVNDILYINEECFSKSDALKRAQESEIYCSCGAQVKVGQIIVLGKSKGVTTSQCICGKEYFIVVKIIKNKSNGKINLQCHKWPMSEELKAFYLKQKKIDDAIIEYAQEHGRNKKNFGNTRKNHKAF